MHEADEHAAERLSHTAPEQSDVSAAEQTYVLAASTFSVHVLAADEHHPHVAVLSVHGEIDLATAPMLREVLAPVLEHQTGPVVVDLSDVLFMDSTGVHVLTEALRRLAPQNRPLAIVCHDGGQVHRLLALLGLLDALTMYSSRERAVIGVEDLLRSHLGENSQLFNARTATQSLASAGQPTHMLAGAAPGTGHGQLAR
jgi:anti-sigma B factor antagonist